MSRRFLFLAFAGILLPGFVALAQTSDVPEDFTFHRVKVGEGKPGHFITVQIDPVEQARKLAILPKVAPVVPQDHSGGPIGGSAGMGPGPSAPSDYSWFWEKVSPALGAVSDRFVLALAALGEGPDGSSVAAPRMQALQDIAARYGKQILAATIGTEVSPALVLAVIGVESAGRPEAVSKAGAQGLMQLIPATAERFGVDDSLDAAQNIRGGVAYLDWLMKSFDRDPLMVLAAYNAGEGAVTANAGVPPYAETRDYVPKVLAAWQVAQGLCQSPPELVSDPCVFKVVSAVP